MSRQIGALMPQKRSNSFFESTVSTVVGFFVSLAMTATVLPAYGFHLKLYDAWEITALFSIASILRGYLVRRLFNAQENRA